MNDVRLLIETSGRGGCVGLAVANQVEEIRLDESRRHARDLAASVARLLRDRNLAPDDVTAVLVSVGPGSYTGLRVGLASAKAFAYAVGCDLVAVPTFHAIAERTPGEFAAVDVLADALQGLIYVHRFVRGPAGWQPGDVLRIVPAVEWAATASVAVTGPAAGLHEANVPQVPGEFRTASAASLLAAGLKLKPATRAELFALEPLYLRGSSAEEQAARAGK